MRAHACMMYTQISMDAPGKHVHIHVKTHTHVDNSAGSDFDGAKNPDSEGGPAYPCISYKSLDLIWTASKIDAVSRAKMIAHNPFY